MPCLSWTLDLEGSSLAHMSACITEQQCSANSTKKPVPPVWGITRPLSAHRNPLIIHTPMNSDQILSCSGGKNGNGGVRAMHVNNGLLF